MPLKGDTLLEEEPIANFTAVDGLFIELQAVVSSNELFIYSFILLPVHTAIILYQIPVVKDVVLIADLTDKLASLTLK